MAMSAFAAALALLLLAPCGLAAVAELEVTSLAAEALEDAKASATPTTEVITLLEDLKSQVETEGSSEAGVYAEFACFCKDATGGKSAAITRAQDTIDLRAADIQAGTAQQAHKASDVAERQMRQGGFTSELEASRGRCLKEAADFEASVADLAKAVASLEKAVTTLSGSKPAAAADVLIALKTSMGESVILAAALRTIKEPKQTNVRAFLQLGVDPTNPEYEFKSQGVVDLLTKLLSDFTAKKIETQNEWDTATHVCTDMQKSLSDSMEENDGAMEILTRDIESLKMATAQSRVLLVQTESLLKDDQVYLQDVTERCEARAKVWDQRTALRKNELEAISGALSILTGQVQSLDAVNVRALLQQPHPGSSVSPALLQQASSRHLLTRLGRVGRHRAEQRRLREARAQDVLSKAAARLGSPTLSALAERVAADPFKEVKGLVQKLIERLLDESAQEATKKGYCDEQIGKSTKSRDYRMADVDKLSTELGQLEAKKDSLVLSIASLKQEANSTAAALSAAEAVRGDDHAVNVETIAKAREGLKAISNAITILKEFYKSAAKAKVFLQESPVEADDPGAGFEGVYKGKQEASTGIFGLLEVIRSDFERTLGTTDTTEKQAAADFVDFDRASRASIAEKEKGRELSEQDLGTTNSAITQKMADMAREQTLVDQALKALEDLKPMCLDNVMTFAERSAKREEEVAALKAALCYLDPEKVEAECK